MSTVKIVIIMVCLSSGFELFGADFFCYPRDGNSSSSGDDSEAQLRVKSPQAAAAVSPITRKFLDKPTEMQPLVPGRQSQPAAEAASVNRIGPVWITCIVGTTIGIIAGAVALQSYRNREWKL